MTRVRKILLASTVATVVLAAGVGIAAYRAVATFDIRVPPSLAANQPGGVVSVARTGKYPGMVVQYLLDSVELPEPIDVTDGVTLYRVAYRTTNHDGSPTVASGLMALPSRSRPNSVVMYFHGTSAQRSAAPSQPGLGEGALIAAAAAGQGHVLLAPDYIGLGDSRELHPYMHTATTVATCVDYLHAARGLIEHLRGSCPESLYLMGFSQGGHATIAVQRELESSDDERFTVRAAAPIAGPFYLRDVSFPQAMTGQTDSHVFYLAYLANSYAHIYGHPLESLLVPPHAEQVPIVFDGDHRSAEISAAMPEHPRDLFSDEFLAAYEGDRDHWFLQALAENAVRDFTPRAPVRIYYGDEDVDVSPDEARRATAAMSRRGADVTAISVGAHDHNGSALYALPQAIRWFTELARQQPGS